MPYVITRLCRDCVDGACIPVCPVSDTIVEPRDRATSSLPNQLFINPDTCIDCGACELECPWGAISLDDEVPRLFVDDIALNAVTASRPHDFMEAKIRTNRKPTTDEVDENRRRWESASEQSDAADSSPA